MRMRILSPPPPVPLSVLITLLLLLTTMGSSIDYRFLTCNPKSCGNGPNIRFPFFIQGDQESFCGYPGFNLTCNNSTGYPILKLSNADYTVRQIFYQNQSLFLNFYTSDICSSPIQNLSLPDDRFRLSPDNSEADLFSRNCRTFCYGENKTSSSISSDGSNTVTKNESASVCVKSTVKRAGLGGEFFGFSLDWTASNCSPCEESGGKCGFSETSYHFSCFCPDRPHSASCIPRKSKRNTMIIAIAASVVAALGLLIFALICFFPKLLSSVFWWNKKSQENKTTEAILRSHGMTKYKYSQVKRMTMGFKEKLGQGGFGSVFKGKLPDGRLVAVKVLKGSKGNGEDFINEVASISRTSHINIVPLFGYCFEGSKRALIYGFMSNGSLERYIYDENNDGRRLGWETLHKIAVGIAQGLEYLHRGCNTRILHFDIKPHNILLDENFCPRISDFGLAKICPQTESIVSLMGTRGTPGYIAPEVFSRRNGGVSHKSDVYSYGMMVLEMIGGRKNICAEADHSSSEIYYPHVVFDRLEQGKELGIRGVNNDEENILARRMVVVSLWCIQVDPSNRPAMCRVVEMLKTSLDLLPIPPKP